MVGGVFPGAFMLLSPRALVALLFLLALAFAAFMGYRGGVHVTKGEWAQEREVQAAQALKASEEARVREGLLTRKAVDVDRKLQTEKALRRAADERADGSLRELQTAVAAASTSSNPTASSGADDAVAGALLECAGTLVQVDKDHRSAASIARALQGYAAEVCVNSP